MKGGKKRKQGGRPSVRSKGFFALQESDFSAHRCRACANRPNLEGAF